jgi:hypothetical protein
VGLKGAASYANPGDASTHWSAASRGSVAGWGFLAVLNRYSRG